jgi:hypothetical protein
VRGRWRGQYLDLHQLQGRFSRQRYSFVSRHLREKAGLCIEPVVESKIFLELKLVSPRLAILLQGGF